MYRQLMGHLELIDESNIKNHRSHKTSVTIKKEKQHQFAIVTVTNRPVLIETIREHFQINLQTTIDRMPATSSSNHKPKIMDIDGALALVRNKYAIVLVVTTAGVKVTVTVLAVAGIFTRQQNKGVRVTWQPV